MSKDDGEIIHQTLFACTECGARHKFVDLSPEEQLCRECRRKYPLKNCAYCQMEFYWMGATESSAVCKRCKRDHHVHGKPSPCNYCKVKAAFSGGKCFRLFHLIIFYTDQCEHRGTSVKYYFPMELCWFIEYTKLRIFTREYSQVCLLWTIFCLLNMKNFLL